MAQYIKMTNGAVKVLVDDKDVATLEDKVEDGFYPELDKNGDFIKVDSTSLIKSENDVVNEILNMLKAKQVQATKTKSVTGRAGRAGRAGKTGK